MSIKTITRRAPAKINLYLEIKAKRPDGYHDIESVMQTVDLFDILTLTSREGHGSNITIECTNKAVPCDESNLCHRAAREFFDSAEIDDYDIAINIDKHIPMAAGLGGGSSDAAAVLLLLNELYGVLFTTKQLCDIGAKIGADVPFCIVQGISITRGIGDVFVPCEPLPDCFFVIACAGEGVSTPWAYKRLDEMYDFASREVSAERLATAIGTGDITNIASVMTNIFESAVLPEREAAHFIRDALDSFGAEKAMMSGSGPSVFGAFTDEDTAEKAAQFLLSKGITAHVCKPYYPAK